MGDVRRHVFFLTDGKRSSFEHPIWRKAKLSVIFVVRWQSERAWTVCAFPPDELLYFSLISIDGDSGHTQLETLLIEFGLSHGWWSFRPLA